jgi:hypothetical protein
LDSLKRWEADYPPSTHVIYNDQRGINIKQQRQSIQKFAHAVMDWLTDDLVLEHGTQFPLDYLR